MSNTKRDGDRLVLSAVTIVALAAFFRLVLDRVAIPNLALEMLWSLLPLILATVIGGAIALRLHGLSWRELVGVTVVVFTVAAAYAALRMEGGASLMDRFKQFVSYLVSATGGVFLLPLVDPAARKDLNPKTFKRIGISLAILLVLLISIDTALSRAQGGAVGLLTLIIGSLIAAISIGTGLVLSIVTTRERGIWAGSLGISLFISCYIVWLSFGAVWFP